MDVTLSLHARAAGSVLSEYGQGIWNLQFHMLKAIVTSDSE